MKKVLLFCLLFYCGGVFSQANNSSTNFIVGLPKIATIQLELLKKDLLDLPQIMNAEYIFKEHCLLIESDFKTNEPLLYEHLEKVLLKYFAPEDIYKKDISAFEQMRLENIKSDKYVIKTTPH
jgi:hypothetical protein